MEGRKKRSFEMPTPEEFAMLESEIKAVSPATGSESQVVSPATGMAAAESFAETLSDSKRSRPRAIRIDQRTLEDLFAQESTFTHSASSSSAANLGSTAVAEERIAFTNTQWVPSMRRTAPAQSLTTMGSQPRPAVIPPISSAPAPDISRRLKKSDVKKGNIGEDSGAINTVTKHQFKKPIVGSNVGYFKAEPPKEGHLGNAAYGIGIRAPDLRASSRSVATSLTDEMLGLNVAARTRFFQYGGQDGTVSEAAPGMSLVKGDVQTSGFSYDHDYRHKETQKGMNRLQWLDALTGQVDRHGGNIYIDPVTGKVTGIDHDASFGSKYSQTFDSNGLRDTQGHNRGLPQMIDAETAAKFRGLNWEEMEQAYRKTRLSDAEIENTRVRLEAIRAHINTLADNQMIIGARDAEGRYTGRYKDWGSDTYHAEMANAENSYLGINATMRDENRGIPGKVVPPEVPSKTFSSFLRK
ncbi:hypothetical protein EKD04_024940 [Chloroflexales bacterium ZM16-3]|nr:hypothetical protein [Chloroflexales bacterium ZM16-3]